MRRPPFHAKGCALVLKPTRGPVLLYVCTRCGSAMTTDREPSDVPVVRYNPTRNACPEPKAPIISFIE